MSLQDALQIAGIVLLTAATALAAAAAYTYRALDIRGVKDDLAGRRREGPSTKDAKPRINRQAAKRVGAASAAAGATTGDSKPPTALPAARSGDAAKSPQAGRSRPDDATDVLATPARVRDSAPSGHPIAPAIQFRVTRKEIVAASDKTIEG